MDVKKIRHCCHWEDVRQRDDNAAQILADSSSLVAVSDPIFAPVRKLPPEMLAKIFIECTPSLEPEGPLPCEIGIQLHQVRARLGQVCRMWNAILNDEPGIWATLVLDNPLLPLEIISLWIKRSKSHPLDVSIQINSWDPHVDMDARDTIFKMLRRELWRIRSFFADSTNYSNISPLFPLNVSTEAPMMQSLTLHGLKFFPNGRLGYIHCPQLRTLSLRNGDKAVKSLMSKPMQNLRFLTIINYRGNNMLYIKLLQALPNLVSLTWSNSKQSLDDEIPRVALPSLKFLAFRRCHGEITTSFLRSLDVPSLEHLDLERFEVVDDLKESLNMVLDVICRDGAVQLRRLALGDRALRGTNLHAIWHHLNHLETLSINARSNISADELFIALSPRNRDFSSACPQLTTLELSNMVISMGALVDFVQRRVKSDLGGPEPGLVTCLKLSNMEVVKEVSAQIAQTHSLSVHLHRCRTSPLAHDLAHWCHKGENESLRLL